MAMKTLRERRDEQAAFVLHTYPYRETSVIVETLTEEHGRVALVARGAKRPRSELRGVLQAFQPLTLSWAGTGRAQDAREGRMARRPSAARRCRTAVRLLPERAAAEAPAARGSASGAVDAYAETLLALTHDARPAAQAVTLRRFEVRLLAELGYALVLTTMSTPAHRSIRRNATITRSTADRGGWSPSRAQRSPSSAARR